MEQINPNSQALAIWSTKRFVKVAPPTVHAGIGAALRQAYLVDGEARSLAKFADLLDRLK